MPNENIRSLLFSNTSLCNNKSKRLQQEIKHAAPENRKLFFEWIYWISWEKVELYAYIKIYLYDKIHYPTGSYLFKVNKGNTRAMREICSKLKIKGPEQYEWRFSRSLISNFEHISLSISKCPLGTFRYNSFTIYCDNVKL